LVFEIWILDMTETEMKVCTRPSALPIFKPVGAFLRSISGGPIALSATSLAAGFRAARWAGSRANFMGKLGIVGEEADETGFWWELIVDNGPPSAAKLSPSLKEGQRTDGELRQFPKNSA
jgi:hypothetical protein